MPSVQRYLSGHNNLARTAALAASSVRASTAIERVLARRSGSGRVRLLGNYTGHEATGVEVEVVAAGGVPRASVPQFVGVGNGQLAVQSVDAGAPLQEFTLTLADLGVETATAGLDVREVRIRARVPGSSGNALRITVQPALTRTATEWALLAPWSTGQPTQTGPQWDFGGLPLSPKDELDAASPRIAFGADPQVYRPWRKFKDGAWQFGLSPALQRDVPAKTPVWSVAGGYVVTVSDGVATETFGDTQASPAQLPIVTFYDLLTALASSALVEVAGVVAADRTSGGQAAIDVPLRTSAWLWAMSGAVALQDVAVPDQAPTQTLTVRCINNDAVGKERWSVVGDVSGALPVAQTGVAYAVAGVIGFTVPVKTVLGGGGGDASYTFSPVDRGDMEGLPCVALRPIKLGVAATPQTVTFKYMPRPPADCRCDAVPSPKVSDKCLGIDPEGGDGVLDPEHASRLQALYEWRRDFLDSNTEFGTSPYGFGQIRSDEREVEIANGITSAMAAALGEIYEVAAARDRWDIELGRVVALMLPLEGVSAGAGAAAPGFTTSFAWSENVPGAAVGEYFKLLLSNGCIYRVTETDAANVAQDAPVWATAPGAAVEYLNFRYVCHSKYWTAGAAVAANTIVEPGNGSQYITKDGGISGSTDVLGEMAGGAAGVTDGTVVWEKLRSAGGSSAEIHVVGDVSVVRIDSGDKYSPNRVLVIYRGGTEVVYDGRAGVNEEAAEHIANANFGRIAPASAVIDMIEARMDYVRTLAGIVPKTNPSSGDAGGCWVDHGGDWWWVDTSGRYLPAFTNQGYVSAKRNKDTGKPESTKEFGFGLVVACPERLKKGDEITLRILTVDAERPYRVGDEAVLQTIGAGAAWLTGGIDGTDVQTWRVLGSSAGALPDYVVPTDGTAAPLYEQAGVALRLALGGIAFQLGDAFTFAVEAGQFRWRRSGGAWSALADIPPGGQVALADGLQAAFDAGAAPSFVPGDAYAFAVHQPWAASHVQDAQATAWGWEGNDASMTIDLGTVRPLGAMALARYQLPGGAAVAAEVSQDGVAWSAPLALDVTRAVSVAMFHLALAARFVRLSVTNAPGGSIGWVWCGQPLTTEHHASTCERLRRWAATRGGGLNAAALYAGAGTGWKLAWDNALLEPDVAALLRMGDWAQAHDEPLIFVPHPMHEADASLVRWGADALQVSDLHAYQPDNDAWRLMSATLDLEPVFA